MAEHGIEKECLRNRRRIGQAGCLNDDAIKFRKLAILPAIDKVPQALLQICSKRAADAAVLENDGVSDD